MEHQTLTTWTFAHDGAFAFGAVLGWLTVFVNRYRTGAVQLGDLTTLVGIFAGAGVTALLDDDMLFGAYGMGLAAGFFSYLLMLMFLVVFSDGYGAVWFLDGRRKKLADDEEIPEGTRQTVTPFLKRTLETLSGAVVSSRADAGKVKDEALMALNDAGLKLEDELRAHAPGSTAAQAVKVEMQKLNGKILDLKAARIRDTLAGKDLAEALVTLKSITKRLTDEAGRMKKATNALNKAGKVLGIADELIAEFNKHA